MLIDEFSTGDPHRHFIVSWPLDMSADTEHACPGAFGWRSDGGEPFGTPVDDVWKVRERFDIVDDGRFVIQAMRGGKRRFDPGQPALAFQRFEQGGLFSTDVGAGATMDPHIYGHAGALNVLADVAGPAGVIDGLLKNLRSQHELAAYINVGGFRSDGITGQHDPLEHLMRISFHELAILKGARFALVGIAAQVTGPLVVFG